MKKEHSFCRYCGGRWPDEKLSNRGICPVCAAERALAAQTQMQARFGPIYDRWRINYIAAMSGVLNRLRKEMEQDDVPF